MRCTRWCTFQFIILMKDNWSIKQFGSQRKRYDNDSVKKHPQTGHVTYELASGHTSGSHCDLNTKKYGWAGSCLPPKLWQCVSLAKHPIHQLLFVRAIRGTRWTTREKQNTCTINWAPLWQGDAQSPCDKFFP